VSSSAISTGCKLSSWRASCSRDAAADQHLPSRTLVLGALRTLELDCQFRLTMDIREITTGVHPWKRELLRVVMSSFAISTGCKLRQLCTMDMADFLPSSADPDQHLLSSHRQQCVPGTGVGCRCEQLCNLFHSLQARSCASCG
jgi:hypothetical protein